MSNKLYDAIVVGAGPVGSYIAYRLADNGYNVIVFERKKTIANAICCTGILGSECMAKFPVGREAVVNQASSAKFFSPSGRCLTLRKAETQAYIVDREVYEQTLYRKAVEAGAIYHLGSQVNDLSLADHSITATVESGDITTDFQGKIAIICGGFETSLPKKLGLGKRGDFVLGVQAEVQTKNVDEIEVYLGRCTAPGFFAWLVPTYNNKALAGLLTRRNPGDYLNNFLNELRVYDRILSATVPYRYGGIPLTPLRKTYGERMIVVGDAAGQVKPTTGGGIYYGLLCADIAVDIAKEAFQSNNYSSRKLAAYHRRWKNKLSNELRVGYIARRLFEKLDDRRIEYIFSAADKYGIHEDILNSPDISFDWHSSSILKAVRHKPIRRVIWALGQSVLPFSKTGNMGSHTISK